MGRYDGKHVRGANARLKRHGADLMRFVKVEEVGGRATVGMAA